MGWSSTVMTRMGELGGVAVMPKCGTSTGQGQYAVRLMRLSGTSPVAQGQLKGDHRPPALPRTDLAGATGTGGPVAHAGKSEMALLARLFALFGGKPPPIVTHLQLKRR